MGTGTIKREQNTRRYIKWAHVFRTLDKQDNRLITNLDDLIQEALAGRKLKRGDYQQLRAMTRRVVEVAPGGYRVLPSKLKPILARLPAPKPVRVPSISEATAPMEATATVAEAATTMVPEVAPPPLETAPVKMVTPDRILILNLDEARALVEACRDGLPTEFPLGTPTKLGALTGTFKTHDFVGSVGWAKGARLLPDAAAFERTKFTVGRQGKSQRLKLIPVTLRKEWPEGTWLEDLRRQVTRETKATVESLEKGTTPPETPPEHPPLPKEGQEVAERLLGVRLTAAEQELADAEREALPFVAKVEIAKSKVAEVRQALDWIRAAATAAQR